jgi:hypothetical protein
MKIKKGMIFVSAILLMLVFFILNWKKIMPNQTLYQLDEPMLISSNKGESYYMLPKNTVLHLEQSFAEGHQLYAINVFSKGKLPATQIREDASIESTWIYPMDAEDVSKILQQYPLSKSDLIQILKARKMTRDDLAQIVRDWKDE